MEETNTEKSIVKTNTVKSILKAFTILEEIDKNYEMSIGELSESLKMDKGTVHRLVSTMREAGYIIQNPDNRKYHNSLKLFAMGNRVVEKTGIKQIARPYMEKLAEETNETVNLGMRIAGEIVYIDKIESHSTIKVGIDIGTSIPDYCTGMGKAILAFLPEEERKEILEETTYRRYAKNTPMNKDAVEENLKIVKNLGFSTDDEEFVEGLISFGAPILDFHGKPMAAISASCPKYRYLELHEKNDFPNKVIAAASEISRQLGFKSHKKF